MCVFPSPSPVGQTIHGPATECNFLWRPLDDVGLGRPKGRWYERGHVIEQALLHPPNIAS